MPDTYLDLVNSGAGAAIASKLGLPRPAPLQRYRPGDPLVDGPVLVLGSGPDADAVARLLSGPAGGSSGVPDGWDLDVHRHAAPGERYAGIVLVLTGISHPGELAGPVLEAGSTLRSLRNGGRVFTVSRPALDTDAPAVAAARQGVDGMLRSLAKELRGGATGNGVVVAAGVPVSAPSAVAALRFLLSRKSAFVDGQLVQVDSDGGELPASWEEPLAGRVAVVTGAARGIGAVVVEVLARDARTVLPGLLAAVTGVGVAVRSVAVEEPDLEAVFLHVTGKSLRD